MKNEEGKLLGKNVEYPKNYCPAILVAIPRTINREIYGILQADELFCGYDSWHAYEASFLLDNGMPVCGILKIVYLSDSPFIVESKSLKLYLGSFAMANMGISRMQAAENFIRTVETDLSHLLSTTVKAQLFGQMPEAVHSDFCGYTTLEELIVPEQIHFSIYQEHPGYLSENIRPGGELKNCSHLLKSNCKITNQPDWGSVYIHIKATQLPDAYSLLKYIVSLRNENHFHEEICEMTFKRLTDIFQPEILMVCCLYTRRGGIDICPARASQPKYLPQSLIQPEMLAQREFRQ